MYHELFKNTQVAYRGNKLKKGTPRVICGHILNLSSLVKKFSAKRIARTVGREMTDEILYKYPATCRMSARVDGLQGPMVPKTLPSLAVGCASRTCRTAAATKAR